MSFHSRDGLYFTRLTDGTVRVSREVPVHDAMGDFAKGDRAVLWSVDLPENEWASVVASMSARGESGDTWQAVREFHSSPSSVPIMGSGLSRDKVVEAHNG